MVIVGIWAGLFGLYLLFAGSASRPEALAGLIVSSIALAGHVRTREVAHRRLEVRAPWLTLAWRIVVALLRDTVLVGGGLVRTVLGREPGGGLAMQPFDSGDFTPAAAARRGIAMLAASVAPNGYVIEVQEPPRGMLMHSFVPRQRAHDLRWPV